MVNLDTSFSRRELLKAGGAATVSLLVPASENEAKFLIRKGQQYIDEIVKEEPSPYVRKVIYDYDGSLLTKRRYIGVRRILDDPQVLRYFARYAEDLFGRNLTEDRIQSVVEAPKFVKDAIVFILRLMNFRTGEFDDNFATVLSYPSDFGKRVKSDVYVLGDTLEQISIATPKGDIKIPTKERVRSTLQHEYTHAKDIHDGVDLGNGLVIDSSNYFNINPRAEKFVTEGRAYLREVEFSRQFGKDNPAYWFALGQFTHNMDNYYNRYIKNRKFTPYETQLIEFQQKKVDEINLETKRIFEKFKLIKCSTNHSKY